MGWRWREIGQAGLTRLTALRGADAATTSRPWTRGGMRLFNRYPCLRSVVVNLKAPDAPTFRGVLWRKTGGYYVLRNAQMLRPRMEAIVMDGEVVIPADNVLFFQVI